jgi:hypothetical protein
MTDDSAIGNRMINARADAVATKSLFRSAFERRQGDCGYCHSDYHCRWDLAAPLFGEDD